MYTDLIFDLYGTLVDIRTEESLDVWEKTSLYFGYYGAHYTAEELKANFEEEVGRREGSNGQNNTCFPDIPFHDILADLFRRKGITENADLLGMQAVLLFRICATEYIRLYPHVLESLTLLRKKGYRLWLLSNAQEVCTRHELKYLGLEGAFDGIYLSSCFGYRKPDGRFFRALIEEQKLDISKCLMIGNDRETDIAGANAVGIDTFYLHTALTPNHQSPADPENPMEFEGDDWCQIKEILCKL